MKRSDCGFTLIEVLVVLTIISILAMLALPSKNGQINRIRIEQTLNLFDDYQASIVVYYKLQGGFPESNADAGLPEPNQIIGNFLQSTTMQNGALHAQLGNKISPGLVGQYVSLRPIFVPGAENAPVSWICGYDTVPNGMLAAGDNRTNVDIKHLPMHCR